MRRIEQVPLKRLRTEGTQLRVTTSMEVVADYTAALNAGAVLPLGIAFWDGADYWLADGHHSALAHAAARPRRAYMNCDVRDGTLRDAVLYAASANLTHGLPASQADRRNAVAVLLADAEWRKWNNCQIARHCGVSEHMVRGMKAEQLSSPASRMEPITVERGGTVYTMTPAARLEPPAPDPAAEQAEDVADAVAHLECAANLARKWPGRARAVVAIQAARDTLL